jgi:hypothetical protein
VTIEFAGQKKTATAPQRRQVVTLDSMPASSAGRTMTVASSTGRQKAEIKDVLVGEVCFGQSNMSHSRSRFRNCADEVPQMLGDDLHSQR